MTTTTSPAVSASATGPLGRPIRPVAYPTAIVLAFLDASGVSPYAAFRTFILVAVVTLAASVALTWLTGDRHRAGVIALLLVLLVAAGATPVIALLLPAALGLMLGERAVAARRPLQIRWPTIGRALSTVAAILLLAIAIRAMQDGRAMQIARDLVAEGPIRVSGAVAWRSDRIHPDVYLVLLDGYPRADKLDQLGVDSRAFEQQLRAMGFFHRQPQPFRRHADASHTRRVLNGTAVSEIVGSAPPQGEWHEIINDAAVLEPFREAGYEVISVSSGYEIVALRRCGPIHRHGPDQRVRTGVA